MSLTKKKLQFFLAFFVTTILSGCGHSDLESQLVEENAQAPVSLPAEVISAMAVGMDEVEVPIDSSEGGFSKPTEFSRLYLIDYQEYAEEVREKAAPPVVSPICGSSPSYKIKLFKWKTFPILYSIATDGLTAGVDPITAKEAIVKALNAWDILEAPEGDLFLEAKGNATPSLTIRWGKLDGKNKVLAVAENAFNTKTKTIISSRITFDSSETWKVFSASSCESQGSEFDIESIAAHEAGHVIGIVHPVSSKKNQALTMFATTAPGETEKRTLNKGDAFGIKKLYPKKKK